MFAQVSSIVALCLAVANAAPVSFTSSSDAKPTPTGYATARLEPYKEYNIRYVALNCTTQHNTTFFDECCHPLMANETLSGRPEQCTPGQSANATASAVYASETSNNTEVYIEFCDEATEVASEAATETASSEWTAPSSSYEQAAEPTSSPWVEAAVVSTSSAAPSTSTSAAPAATTSASSGGDWKTGGHATYYYQNGNAGACGWYKGDSDKLIAINGAGYWQNTGETSQYCGKWINIVNTENGKTTTAMVADVCPSCVDSTNSLDLSVGAFQDIASLDAGSVSIKWSFA